jgi:hypothetical protein
VSLRDLLLEHYFDCVLVDKLVGYPVRIALAHAARLTPSCVGFERAIKVTSLARRVVVFESNRGVVRYRFRYTGNNGFAFKDGAHWTCR